MSMSHSLEEPSVLYTRDRSLAVPPYQTVIQEDGQECLDSGISSFSGSHILTAVAFDHDRSIVYACGGKPDNWNQPDLGEITQPYF